MSASGGGSAGKRTVADVLMGNARAAASKAKKAAPSPKKPRAKTDGAEVEPEAAAVAEKPPSPVRSKRASSPAKSPKSMADGSTSPAKSKGPAAVAQLDAAKAKENSPSPKRSKTLAAKSDTQPSDSPKTEEKNITLELKKKGSEFDPMAAAFWKPGEPVPFLFLARALDLISNESGRIVITEILSNVFRTVMATTPDDLLATVYLSANRIAPPHEGIELGIGDASIIRALAEAYGRKEEHVKKDLKVVKLVTCFYISSTAMELEA